MNTTTYTPDTTTEIDLVALLKKLLLQWKAVLIFSLIIGLIAGGVKYAKDNAGYRAALSTYESGTSSQKVLENSQLTVAETDAVKQAVAQKKQINDLSDYLNDSLYMNLNPLGYKSLSILYYIQAQKGRDASDILTVYSEMLQSDNSIKKIQEASGLDTEPQYIKELLQTTDAKSTDLGSMTQESSTDIMKVTFMLPDGANASAIDKAIEKLVKDYNIDNTPVSGGTVKRISSRTTTVTSRDIQTTRQTYINNIAQLKTSYKTATDAFSDDQNTLLTQLLRENDLYDEETAADIKESAKRRDENDKDSADSSSSSEDTSEETDTSAEKPVPPSFSAKYFAIGFVLGIIIYVFLELIYEILRSRCTSVSVMEDSLILGSLLNTEGKKKNFFLSDSHLEKVLYRKQSDTDNVVDRILTRFQMNSGKEHLDSLELWTVGFTTTTAPVVERIVSTAKLAGVNITIHPTTGGHPDSMINDLKEDSSVALVYQDGTTRKKDLAFLIEMLATRNADYLGAIELL